MKQSGWVVAVAVAAVGCGAAPAKAPGAMPGDLAGVPAEPASSSAPAPAPSPSPAKPSATTEAASVEAAKLAAQSWLALVDAEKYADSWTAAASGFQKAVSTADWTRAVAGVRQPLGKLVSRQLRLAEYKTSLPGVPDGKYVVIQFDTAFEHKPQAVETVTPTQEPDGAWKVSGYFIK